MYKREETVGNPNPAPITRKGNGAPTYTPSGNDDPPAGPVTGGGSSGGGGGGGVKYNGPGYQVQKIDNADYINKMYDTGLAAQKQQLAAGYEQNQAKLDEQAMLGQRATDANLNRTYIEAAKQQKNNAEMQNAYGLSSGARAQAQIAHNNALASNLTTIRQAQRDAEEQLQRDRANLSKEYTAAIAKAQADNDYNRAQALYQAAKDEENRELEKQKEIAALMMKAKDYSTLKEMYGLDDAQIKMLRNAGVTK